MVSLRRLKRKLIKLFFREQWSLLICDLAGTILRHIVPPKGIIWADPFPVETDGKTYIFIEQQIGYSNGTLGYIELYPDLSCSDFITILEKPYHLSFPNVFCVEKHGRKLWYMIPESHENRTIDLYRADNFPDRWIHETTLMDDIEAVDSTIFFHDAKWWLFTSSSSEGLPLNRNLSVFFSNSLTADKWTAHPQNPVCRDAGNSRMAGALYYDEKADKLFRPAQSCIKEYGERVHINEILSLTEEEYVERMVRTVYPERSCRAVCTHTYNVSRNYLLRDIKTRRLKSTPSS
ncbi:hypothetical protein LJC14_00825 [Treponema sp. OttesenSCG-928-L16]|nr:hypothetical protein [Treponema sp. OttesenSCG-928-L16]